MEAALGVDLRPRNLLVIAGLAVLAAVIALQPPPGNAPGAMIALAIVGLTVGLWATAALPTLHASLVFFALALAAGTAAPAQLLAGFWSNAAALIVGGLVIGAAADRTGLGRAVARVLMGGMTASYSRFIVGVLVGSGVLSFLIPTTMGRLAITLPILAAATKEAGYEPGSRGHIGIIVTAVAGNYLTSYAVMPANLTNVLTLGAVEAMGGPVMTYAGYFAMCMPVLGLVKGFMVWAAVRLLLPAPPPRLVSGTAGDRLGREGFLLAIVLALTVFIWATDFAHGVKPGWVALGAAIVCLVPGLGLARTGDVLSLSTLTAVVSLAAVIGVATVLTVSGAGGMIATTLTKAVPASATPAAGFAVLAVAASLIATFAMVVGSIAIVTPTIFEITSATGLPVAAGTIAVLTGLQAIFFSYEAVPVMVGLAMGKVAAAASVRVMLALAVTGLLVILPLQMGWMKLIGAMP